MAGDLRRLVVALAVCGAATAAEIVGGALTRSLALTADGLHSLVHVGALLLAIWGATSMAARAPVGAGRAAAINALVIIVLSGMLAVESLSRLSAPQPVAYGPAIALTAFGLLANILTITALGRGCAEDLNHRAVRVHMIGDAAIAVVALIGLGAGAVFGWRWADAASGLVGAALLSALGARLMAQTLRTYPPAASHRA